MKLPDECIAFEYRGRVFEGRPGIYVDGCDDVYITLVDDKGTACHLVGNLAYGNDVAFWEVTTLTQAARDLLAWAVQS